MAAYLQLSQWKTWSSPYVVPICNLAVIIPSTASVLTDTGGALAVIRPLGFGSLLNLLSGCSGCGRVADAFIREAVIHSVTETRCGRAVSDPLSLGKKDGVLLGVFCFMFVFRAFMHGRE